MKTYGFLLTMMLLAVVLSECSGKAGRQGRNAPQPAMAGVERTDTGKYPLDSLDVVMPDTLEEVAWLIDNRHSRFHALTPKEVAQTRNLLKKYIDSGQYEADHRQPGDVSFSGSRLPLPLEKYARQYVGYEQAGHVKVFVQLNAVCTYGASLHNLHHRLLYVKDGGHYFGDATVDLTADRVEQFDLNGEG
ncbi:hypothetical protein [Prevotella sp. KH2C16]|uniref:hypothetical protein n=1 Tax=Prevotella sp. KH2C16 TaxID=1855325 RepID=UPI0008E8C252|nr:hypothetical protein [Prevotella sp. KH2C16]SFF99902.1 hypothetical protein SAMN05216383_103175 [Prevotella sp. KH2C16]